MGDPFKSPEVGNRWSQGESNPEGHAAKTAQGTGLTGPTHRKGSARAGPFLLSARITARNHLSGASDSQGQTRGIPVIHKGVEDQEIQTETLPPLAGVLHQIGRRDIRSSPSGTS
jgi:hypothetical protein